MPPAVVASWAERSSASPAMYAERTSYEIGRMVRQIRLKNRKESVGGCHRFSGKIAGRITANFLFCSLRYPAATRPQFSHARERAGPALRAVGFLGLQYALVFAGHYIVADAQQSAMRQRCGAGQTLLGDEGAVGGI